MISIFDKLANHFTNNTALRNSMKQRFTALDVRCVATELRQKYGEDGKQREREKRKTQTKRDREQDVRCERADENREQDVKRADENRT
jgi:hypothetical protein